MFGLLKLLAISGLLLAMPSEAILKTCHIWLQNVPMAIADVGPKAEHTLLINQNGELCLHDSATGEALREPIALGSQTLRRRYPPMAAHFSADGTTVTVEYRGMGLFTYDSASGLIAPSPSI